MTEKDKKMVKRCLLIVGIGSLVGFLTIGLVGIGFGGVAGMIYLEFFS